MPTTYPNPPTTKLKQGTFSSMVTALLTLYEYGDRRSPGLPVNDRFSKVGS